MMKFVEKKAEVEVVPSKVCGVPRYINHATDLGVHPGFDADGQFVVANMVGEDGREFGFMLHMMVVNPEKDPAIYPAMLSIISFTDITRRQYLQREDVFPAEKMSYSEEGLALKTPISSLTGDAEKIELVADLPQGRGRLEVTLECVGPPLYNCALGAFPFLNDEVVAHQFALPHLRAAGTLRMDGAVTRISGDGWLDRQWGDGGPDFFNRTFKWKWMNLNLDNGIKISVWDVSTHGKNENAWATVLFPTGAHAVVEVLPLSKGESEFWTSPVTGQRYPTKYVVEIPSLDGMFHVAVREGLIEQEVVSPAGEDKYEAACTFSGRFMGNEVKGYNYVELVGSFK